MALTTLSRVTGFGRNVALAYAIGQNSLTDAYNVANTTPNIVFELVLGGVLSATLVPLFVARLSRDEPPGDGSLDAWSEISSVVTLVTVVALAASVAFVAAAPWIIDLYVSADASADQRAVATTLLRLFGPQILFYGLITVTTGVLEARRRFAAPKFAPVANNLVVIATLLALPYVATDLEVGRFRHDRAGLLLLGLGTTAGVGAMAVAQVVRLPAAGARLRLVWAPTAPMIRRLLQLSAWTVGVVVTNQVALWVTYRLATSSPGAQSAYTAALIFFTLPYGVYTVSLMSALGPEMAEQWVRGDGVALGQLVATGLRRVLALMVPAGVGLMVLAQPVVVAILQHGRFDSGDAHRTATTLAALAAGLPGFSAFLLLGRVWQSMQDTRTMFLLYVLENGVNIALALVLHPRFGVQGLAASYAAAYSVAAVVSLAALRRRLGGTWMAGLAGWTARLAGVGVVVAAAAGAPILVLSRTLPAGTTRALVEVAVGTTLGGAALLVAAGLSGVREPLELVDPLRRRIPHLRPGPGG